MKIILFILLFSLVISCKKDESIEDLKEVDIYLLKYESDTTLRLLLRNRTIYPIGNVEIVSDINYSPQDFSIHLLKIKQPGLGIDTGGFASVFFYFPLLSDGEYPMSIKVTNNKTNKGKLIVSKGKFELKMSSTDKIHFPWGNVVEY